GAPEFVARPRGGFASRDQNAVAYDPRTDMFFTGGDDNAVWRYDALHGAAKALSKIEVEGNVTEILLTHAAAPGEKGGAIVGAIDTLEVDVIAPASGARIATLGPLAGTVFNHDLRVDVAADDD